MPSKKKQLRIDGPDPWDILWKTEYEFIPGENRWYRFKSMLIYVAKDNTISKVKIL